MKNMLAGLFLFCLLSGSTYAETVQFNEENSIKIDIPANWETTQLRGTQLPEIVNTFDLKLTSPPDEKATLTITIGKSQTGKTLTKKQFEVLTKAITTEYLRRAVEKKAVFTAFPIRGGQGKYSIFTDASTVDKKRVTDDYKYFVLFLLNYDNGCFVYATGFTDDSSGAVFQNIVKSVSSIEPSFAEIVPTPPVQIKTSKQGAIIGNAVSKVKLRIPSGNLKVMKERIGGGQNSPGYFLLIDTKANLNISGWLEPAENFKYGDVGEFWAAVQSAEIMETLNPELKKIGDWEVYMFDLPVPRVLSVTAHSAHIQALLLQDNAWINLHMSITSEKSSTVLRNELVDYLKTIQILN